jgi:hypothetical protein
MVATDASIMKEKVKILTNLLELMFSVLEW